MIPNEFDAISKEDVDQLVANAVTEGRTIEYKEQLPGSEEKDTREFLADVSSFANASGGDLIYGIREQRDQQQRATGTPEPALGLTNINADAQILRMENMLRDGIEPRMPSVRFKNIGGFASGSVIIIRIGKSWISPHMVKYRGSSRFYSRNSAGKFQLDVREIRSAFLASGNLNSKISAFRVDRLNKILAGETPTPLEAVPKLVLHLLPAAAFGDPSEIDLRTAAKNFDVKKLMPMGNPNRWGPVQYNFDGFVFSGGNGTNTTGYIQLFRNGAIEAVCARISRDNLIFGSSFEQEIMRAVEPYLAFQNNLGFGPPLFVGISLLSVKGLTIYPRSPQPMDTYHSIKPIDRDVLVATDVMIPSENTDVETTLRPALDMIWQASAWPGSLGYGEDGKWIGFAHLLAW